jgi:hypothetical protein
VKVGLTISDLDVESPPVADPSSWVEAPRMFRLINAQSGRIANNLIKGGQIGCFGGPWEMVDNEYRGTPPGTFSHGVFAVHAAHDLIIRGNRAKPVAPAGKTWRFLVTTGYGRHVRVVDNMIEQIGPRDDDTIPNMNAGETILTESYRLSFEGRPAAVSPDGRLICVGTPQGDPPQMGDVVAVLKGPHAGSWRTIAQVVTPNTYLLETPLPPGTEVVSVSAGSIDVRFERNTIDARGGKGVANLVLAGNHFGTVVRDNRILGGGEAFRIQACASEAPVIWGWSHVPFFGGVIEGNLIEDSIQGGLLGVEHNHNIKTNSGRVYMTARLRDNTIRWTDEALRRRYEAGAKAPPTAITIGYRPLLDPGELIVAEKGTRLDAPKGIRQGATLVVHGAMYNGQRIVKRAFSLPTGAVDSAVSRASNR